MRTCMGLAVIALIIVSMMGCATPQMMPSADLQTATKGPSSGDASGKTSGTTFPVGPAFSYMGSATSNATAAGYNPYNTNTGSGSLVTGFVLGMTEEQTARMEETLSEWMKEDVGLQSVKTELEDLSEVPMDQRDDAWFSRVDLLRTAYMKARDSIVASLRSTGVTPPNTDLSQLTTLVNVGIIHSAVGKDERAPTAEESDSLRYLLSNIISAARGEKGIVPPGLKMEGGD